MTVVVCEREGQLKNIKKNWYFNKIEFKIDNLIGCFKKLLGEIDIVSYHAKIDKKFVQADVNA